MLTSSATYAFSEQKRCPAGFAAAWSQYCCSSVVAWLKTSILAPGGRLSCSGCSAASPSARLGLKARKLARMTCSSVPARYCPTVTISVSLSAVGHSCWGLLAGLRVGGAQGLLAHIYYPLLHCSVL